MVESQTGLDLNIIKSHIQELHKNEIIDKKTKNSIFFSTFTVFNIFICIKKLKTLNKNFDDHTAWLADRGHQAPLNDITDQRLFIRY